MVRLVACMVVALLVPTLSFAQSVDSLLSPGMTEHSGLLGKRYLQAQFQALRAPDDLDQFSDWAFGPTFLFNTPLPLTNEMLDSVAAVDFFAGVELLDFGGDGNVSGIPANLDADGIGFSAGVNLHFNPTGRFRPFLGLGYEYIETEIDITAGGTQFTDTDREDGLRVTPGIEVDLMPRLSFRGAINVETDGKIEESGYSAEFIFWPVDRFFLRGGPVGDFEGEWGGVIGGGFTF